MDFSPKHLEHKPGNGFHINVSLSPENSIENMHYMIAGVLNRICEITAFLNPTENSYDRFGENKAPAFVSWSRENRSQLVRVPASPESAMRAELRSPDPSANPYIAFALVIYAALEGLKNKTELMPPADINLFHADEKTLNRFKMIPQTLNEACTIAANSDFVKEHIPKKVLQIYCNQ